MNSPSKDSFSTLSKLAVADESLSFYSIPSLAAHGLSNVLRLPYSLKILLENLLRHEDDRFVKTNDILSLASWDPSNVETSERDFSFMPARVLLHDFTGVPLLVELLAMREALQKLGGDPKRVTPVLPADLIIDHSSQVDKSGSPFAFACNGELEMLRNSERYALLRWGQENLKNLNIIPPNKGICHQINLEFLSKVVLGGTLNGRRVVYPDTLVGMDSHTPMVNALGVLGWGVGGIEAEAAMLGQPISMRMPDVIGIKLHGRLREGTTATDLVLVLTKLLRSKGVVGKFVEFYGAGLSTLTLPDRATIANMAPEYGATVAFFPVDSETLSYLRLTGRHDNQIRLVETYAREQGIFRTDESLDPVFSDKVDLDLHLVLPSIAGPKRPNDNVPLTEAHQAFRKTFTSSFNSAEVESEAGNFSLSDGSIVIAAITSCTNTSNPSLMMAAGLLAKNAVERGLSSKPWVKTSFAPGSKAVTKYLDDAGLSPFLDALGFNLVGYGCMTCNGNSGPLSPSISKAITDNNLLAVSILSGNRNFEGRINPLCRANYLGSPPLVIAYALVGRIDADLINQPLGHGRNGKAVFLRDIWPTGHDIQSAISQFVTAEVFRREYSDIMIGDEAWRALPVPEGDLYEWDLDSTYIKAPPYFDGISVDPPRLPKLEDLRALLVLGDSITTDHISPLGSIPPDSPAGKCLISCGVQPKDFNSYGTRRGNHEVMIRGTFASARLRNALVPGIEGGWTVHQPDCQVMTVYDAAMKYRDEGVQLIVIAGKEYGTGSSRDWAAKGTILLGVRAVLAESYERIHRSNLVGMGVLPLQFLRGESRESLGLTGFETFDVDRFVDDFIPGKTMRVTARDTNGRSQTFLTTARIDTPFEFAYYRHGGILQYVLRQMLEPATGSPA